MKIVDDYDYECHCHRKVVNRDLLAFGTDKCCYSSLLRCNSSYDLTLNSALIYCRADLDTLLISAAAAGRLFIIATTHRHSVNQTDIQTDRQRTDGQCRIDRPDRKTHM